MGQQCSSQQWYMAIVVITWTLGERSDTIMLGARNKCARQCNNKRCNQLNITIVGWSARRPFRNVGWLVGKHSVLIEFFQELTKIRICQLGWVVVKCAVHTSTARTCAARDIRTCHRRGNHRVCFIPWRLTTTTVSLQGMTGSNRVHQLRVVWKRQTFDCTGADSFDALQSSDPVGYVIRLLVFVRVLHHCSNL